MVAKALRIQGVAVGDRYVFLSKQDENRCVLTNTQPPRREAIETLELAERGIVKTHFTTEKMENLTKVFEEMDKGTLKGRVVLDLS